LFWRAWRLQQHYLFSFYEINENVFFHLFLASGFNQHPEFTGAETKSHDFGKTKFGRVLLLLKSDRLFLSGIRVTRLGEISPVGRMLTLASL
jgi:hypothetical protein